MKTLSYSEVIVFEIIAFGHSTAKMHPNIYAQLKNEGWLKKTRAGRIVPTQKAYKFVMGQ